VKVPRPDVGEVSRGQNKVREFAMSPNMQCNTTPTWCKGASDGTVNIVALGFTFALGFTVVSRPARAAPCCGARDATPAPSLSRRTTMSPVTAAVFGS
jgi:hypothetical protein